MLQESLLDSRSEIDRLMEQYGSSLLRMSALYLKDSDLAQDAVQETFIKAYRHLNDYRGESELIAAYSSSNCSFRMYMVSGSAS